MAIALRSVLDMEDDDIAAMLKEKMLGLTEHFFFSKLNIVRTITHGFFLLSRK